MDEQEMAGRLAEMAERRIRAVRARARAGIAVRLLTQQGKVTEAEVEAALDRLPRVDEQTLTDQVAAKAVAAAVMARRELESGQGAVAGQRAKVSKYEQLLDAAQQDLVTAQDMVEDLQLAAAEAEELADYATRLGDPGRVPPEQPATAQADVALGEGSG